MKTFLTLITAALVYSANAEVVQTDHSDVVVKALPTDGPPATPTDNQFCTSNACSITSKRPRTVSAPTKSQTDDCEKLRGYLDGKTPDKALWVKFTASWCGPCKVVEKYLDGLPQTVKDQHEILHIDVDQCPDLARKYGLKSIPVIFGYLDGQTIRANNSEFRIDGIDPKGLRDNLH